MSEKPETATERYIRLLTILADPDWTGVTHEPDRLDDLAGLAELQQAGLIIGEPVEDGSGRVVAMPMRKITVQGRLFLEELKKKESLKTSVGFVKENRWTAYKWILGIIAAVIGGILLKSLQEHFWPSLSSP